MDVRDWAHIRHLHVAEGMTIAAIARKLGKDRKTVRLALQKDDYFVKRPNKRPSILDPFKDAIHELLEDYPGLSGTRMFEELRSQGYQGKATILRDYLRTIRPRHKEPYFRLTMPAGRQAQVDWGHCGVIQVGSTMRSLYCFVFVLSFSRLLYVEFTLSMTQEFFLEAHVKAFRFLGGLPHEMLYDQTKSVVISRVGDDIRFNARFMEFAGYYGFLPRLCTPHRPREKGRVEMGVKFAKKNFLAGRSFKGFEDLRQQAFRWRDEVANVRIHATTRRRPVDLFEQERPCLLPLPENDFDTALRLPFVCPPDAFVTFQTNHYSVPFSCVGKDLVLKADMHHIRIYEGMELVAEHRRFYDRYQQVEDPAHRKAMLLKRKRAAFSKAVDELTALGPETAAYLEGLNRCERKLSHHVLRIQRLLRIYGPTELRQAIEHALAYQAFGADYIENIIVQNRRSRRADPPAGPVQIPSRPELTNLTFQPHDMETYEGLQEEQNPSDRKEKEGNDG